MIMMNTAQQLSETIGDRVAMNGSVTGSTEIERDFVKDDIKCVMEQVAPDGSIIDHIDGSTLKPRSCDRRRLVYFARSKVSKQ